MKQVNWLLESPQAELGSLQRVHTQFNARALGFELLWDIFTGLCGRQRHVLKRIAYQLWSPSKSHCVAWLFPGIDHNLGEVHGHEKGPSSHLSCTAMSSKAVLQKDWLCSRCSEIGNTFSEYRPIFSVLHRYGMCIHRAALMLLCWYLQCCRATCHQRPKWKRGKKENTGANLRQVN